MLNQTGRLAKIIKNTGLIALGSICMDLAAQSHNQDSVQLFDKIDSTLILYIKYSRLGGSGDKIDPKAVQGFVNARVHQRIQPRHRSF